LSKNNFLLTLHGDQQTFYSYLAQFFLESEIFWTNVVGKIKTLILYSKPIFFLQIVLFVRQCGKNFVEPGKAQMTKWRMRFACWIPKITDTLRICNTYCFSTQTIMREHAPLLRYTYIACLVKNCVTRFPVFVSTAFTARK